MRGWQAGRRHVRQAQRQTRLTWLSPPFKIAGASVLVRRTIGVREARTHVTSTSAI
jgi:hypothetical protein